MKNQKVRNQDASELTINVKDQSGLTEVEKPKFISVPIDVVGRFKGKNYVDLESIAYNPQNGNIALHLDEKHTLMLYSSFQKDSVKVNLKSTDKIEQSAKKAPHFENSINEKSNARLRVLGERDGRIFLGATGAVKYDGSYRGLVVNLDDKNMTIVDSEMLSKELGISVNPIVMEKNIGLSR